MFEEDTFARGDLVDYKALARAYHTAVSNYDETTVTKMVREDYIQHNPRVPTGRAAFVGFLPKLKEHQTKIENVRMLNDGRYVAMHHLWKNAVPFGGKDMAAFHIIRFDDAGLIAEHWNVMCEGAPVDGETQIRDREKTDVNKAAVARRVSGKSHKVLGEGNFVLSVSEGARHGKSVAIYELCRLEDGAVVESWSIVQEIPTEGLANDNTMFAFPDA